MRDSKTPVSGPRSHTPHPPLSFLFSHLFPIRFSLLFCSSLIFVPFPPFLFCLPLQYSTLGPDIGRGNENASFLSRSFLSPQVKEGMTQRGGGMWLPPVLAHAEYLLPQPQRRTNCYWGDSIHPHTPNQTQTSRIQHPCILYKTLFFFLKPFLRL